MGKIKTNSNYFLQENQRGAVLSKFDANIIFTEKNTCTGKSAFYNTLSSANKFCCSKCSKCSEPLVFIGLYQD